MGRRTKAKVAVDSTTKVAAEVAAEVETARVDAATRAGEVASLAPPVPLKVSSHLGETALKARRSCLSRPP